MAKLTKEQRKIIKKAMEAYENYEIELQSEIENILEIDPMIDMDNYDPSDTVKVSLYIRDEIVNNIDNVIDRLKELLLPPEITDEMKKFISSIGNTPIDEPDLSNQDKTIDEYMDIVESKSNIKIHENDRDVYVTFCVKVMQHVNGFEDEKGILKTTEKINKFGFLKKDESEKISKITEKYKNALGDIQKKADEDYLKANKKINKLTKVLHDDMIEIINKSRNNLFSESIEWEKELLIKTIERQIEKDLRTMAKVF